MVEISIWFEIIRMEKAWSSISDLFYNHIQIDLIAYKSSPSIYIPNKMGDKTPPCFSPLAVERYFDVVVFHLKLRVWLVNIYSKQRITIGLTFLLIINWEASNNNPITHKHLSCFPYRTELHNDLYLSTNRSDMFSLPSLPYTVTPSLSVCIYLWLPTIHSDPLSLCTYDWSSRFGEHNNHSVIIM